MPTGVAWVILAHARWTIWGKKCIFKALYTFKQDFLFLLVFVCLGCVLLCVFFYLHFNSSQARRVCIIRPILKIKKLRSAEPYPMSSIKWQSHPLSGKISLPITCSSSHELFFILQNPTQMLPPLRRLFQEEWVIFFCVFPSLPGNLVWWFWLEGPQVLSIGQGPANYSMQAKFILLFLYNH